MPISRCTTPNSKGAIASNATATTSPPRPTPESLLGHELRRALERGQVSLLYQPKVRLRDHTLAGAEALLHWNHPLLGGISHERLIHLAEENGMIIQVGDWVLERACHAIE
jgi:EAL domain-containing protein (putative c-di-GMP-specific phosphodiesterase class I)